MTALITFLIISPIIAGICGIIAADEHWDLLDRAATRWHTAARLRDLIDGPAR